MFSKGTGIVCEYNPFHKGHAYQIAKAKQMGASFIVCAMSGDFVQRAEPAFQNKLIRAKNAVSNGADIVLEIPFPYSSMSAEGFAKSAISILENSGLCSSLVFGSECDDVQKLERVAGALDSEFHKSVLSLQRSTPNLSYALAREMLIEKNLGEDYARLLKNPNDILGIEYLKANKMLCPITIKRTTPRGGFDDSFSSSSYIRRVFLNESSRDSAIQAMPENCDLSGIFRGRELFEKYIVLSLMTKTPQELSCVLEVSKGSEYAIIKCAKEAQDYKDLCKMLRSKTFTDAKISRMLLFSAFEVGNRCARQVPMFTQVLASSDLGKKMLKKYKSDSKIVIASRIADIKKQAAAKEQYDLSRKCGEVIYKCENMTR